MTVAEKILRAKADLDAAYQAGYNKGNSEAGSTSTGGLVGTTWVLDENPNLESRYGGGFHLEIAFTCANGVTYEGMWSDGRSLIYTILPEYDAHEMVYDVDSGWVADMYKTIAIKSDWFSENAELQK